MHRFHPAPDPRRTSSQRTFGPCQRLMLWATFAASDLICESPGLWGWPLEITSHCRCQPLSTADRRDLHSTESCPARNAANAFRAAALPLVVHQGTRSSWDAGKAAWPRPGFPKTLRQGEGFPHPCSLHTSLATLPSPDARKVNWEMETGTFAS